jgi:hypothetical protein
MTPLARMLLVVAIVDTRRLEPIAPASIAAPCSASPCGSRSASWPCRPASPTTPARCAGRSGALVMYALGETGDALFRVLLASSALRGPPIHRTPIVATSLREFWGERWNLVVNRWLREHCFLPWARRRQPRHRPRPRLPRQRGDPRVVHRRRPRPAHGRVHGPLFRDPGRPPRARAAAPRRPLVRRSRPASGPSRASSSRRRCSSSRCCDCSRRRRSSCDPRRLDLPRPLRCASAGPRFGVVDPLAQHRPALYHPDFRPSWRRNLAVCTRKP